MSAALHCARRWDRVTSMFEVGVVLAVHNGEAFLREALDSIAAQTLKPTDVVAVDDGSTDRSAHLLRAFGIRTLRTDQAGQALARDRGIAAVRGDVIAFLDQDDRWLPDKLTRQVARLRAEPISPSSARLAPSSSTPAPNVHLGEAVVDKGTRTIAPAKRNAVPRSAFEQVGGFAAARVSSPRTWRGRRAPKTLVCGRAMSTRCWYSDASTGTTHPVTKHPGFGEHLALVLAIMAQEAGR